MPSVIPLTRVALGPLNASHGLANGLQFAARCDAPGKLVNLVNPAQVLATLNYAFNGADSLGPYHKSTANTGNIKLTPTIPVKNGCWAVSTLTVFPVNALDFCVLMANRTANLYHVLKNSGPGVTQHQLITYDGAARLFSPAIDLVTLTGEHRLTVTGHPGGAIAYLDGVFAGSHAFVLNANIEDFLGDPQGGTTNRAWGNSKELFAWNRTLSSREAMDHHLDPFGMFADEDGWLSWFMAVLGGGSGVTISTPVGVLLFAGASIGARAGKSASAVVGVLLLVGSALAQAGKSVQVAIGHVTLVGMATISTSIRATITTVGVLLLVGAAIGARYGMSAVGQGILRFVSNVTATDGGTVINVIQTLLALLGVG